MKSLKLFRKLLVIIIAATFCAGRPQTPNLNQEYLRSYCENFNFNALNIPVPAVERILPVKSNQNYYRDMEKPTSLWDQIYKSPLSKRQVRYRQCYFNPIACFKK